MGNQETRIDPMAEQDAKAALKELGFLVLSDLETGHVYYVSSSGCSDIDDAALESLSALSHLVTLDLSDSSISDEQLCYVSHLPELVCLRLDGTRISDSGLASLADSLNLLALYLDRTKISDEGLSHIARMRRLQWLGARDTAVTEEGLRQLQLRGHLKVVYGESDNPNILVR